MDHPSFNQIISEGLKTDAVLDIHTALRARMDESLATKIAALCESDEEKDFGDEVLAVSKTFNGYGQDQHNGVLIAYFETRQQVEHFSDYLEKCSYVDYYEVDANQHNQDGTVSKAEDIDAIIDNTGYEFRVLAYLLPEYTQFDDEYSEEDVAGPVPEDDEDDGDSIGDAIFDLPEAFVPTGDEALDEVMRVKHVNARGVKRVKMQCQKGFKWVTGLEVCAKITGKDLTRMRKASRRALITKRAKGSGFKLRIKRRTARAMRFRKSMGLGR